MKITIATCREFPDLESDERLLVSALSDLGITAQPACWDDESYAWGTTPACVIRSTWDYTTRHAAFVAWANRVASMTTLMNDARTVRWNTHKGYLRDLEARGVAIVPTAWVSQAKDAGELGALLEARGWRDAVVKPAVSANARDTSRFARTRESLDVAVSLLAKIVATGDAMIQPYLPSVEARGERSLVFIEGELSHAIRKNPALVASRITHGGETRVEPDADEAVFARDAIAAAMEHVARPLYARVDIAKDDAGAIALMELELVEPSLFLGRGDAAPRLARAIAARLKLL